MTDEPNDDFIRSQIFPRGRVRAFFTLEAVKDGKASEAAGYPIYREVPHVLQVAEGERDGIALPVKAEHRKAYPQEWEAFQARLQNRVSSIRALPGITPAVIATLEELRIHTVEQLAASALVEPGEREIDPEAEELPDEVRGLPLPLAKWRDIALRYLAIRSDAEGRTKPKLRVVDGHLELVEAA